MKLKIYKNYLKEEMDNLKYDKKHPEQYKNIDSSNSLLLILLAILCFFLPVNIVGSFSSHNNELNNFFPKTWICKKCSYDNYEGINSCGICGNKRYK